MFFTVMWSGVCQALGWFFGLFGYKRDGKFAKCVWGMFATSATFIVSVFAIALICVVSDEVEDWYERQHFGCVNPGCYDAEYLNDNLYFHSCDNGKGYVFNSETKEKTLKHVKWIAEPNGEDTLVCFCNGEKRGYFSKNTGKVVIEPKYDHAWIFSEGLACVDDGGKILFIDEKGETVIDMKMTYIPNMDGYVFHGGYCVVKTANDELWGLMDKTGRMALPQEYSYIDPMNDYELWAVHKDDKVAVLDKDMKTVIPFTECSIYINEGTIDMTMNSDHTMRKYDFKGNLIYDFYVSQVRTLEYDKDEILYRTRTHDDDGNEYAVPFVEDYHPKETARLRAYVAGDGYEGLMTSDGHVVMMPLYKDIEAIGYDLYLCTSTNCDKVIVNGKGEIVR